MEADGALRDHLRRVLDWQDAHATFDAAVADVPPALRGRRPDGLPYSPWELLEHLRLAQADILALRTSVSVSTEPGFSRPTISLVAAISAWSSSRLAPRPL